MLTPHQYRAPSLIPALRLSAESPLCADEKSEAPRGEVTDPRSPSRDGAGSPGPHPRPEWRSRGAPGREAQGGQRAGQSPHRTLCGEPRAGAPCPPGSGPGLALRSRSRAAAHRTSGGSDRPSSPGCRCPPRPRCGGSGWSPWCTASRAGPAGAGTRAAAASSSGHGPDQATRTLAHGRGRLGLRAPTLSSAGGPTPRRPSAPRA